MSGVVLHLSPHPDDELIGAPATLMALRDAGWRVVSLACGLGAPAQRARREDELREACLRAGFELRIAAPGEDLAAAIAELEPALLVSPCPQDRHPAHVRVAAAAYEALEAMRGSAGKAPRWWVWALWGWLPRPTVATGFGEARLEQILAALAAHRGELLRNDYRRLVRGRGEAAACLAPELLFGFGAAAGGDAPAFAELLCELVPTGEGWLLGPPRWLDPAVPLPQPGGEDATALASPAGR